MKVRKMRHTNAPFLIAEGELVNIVTKAIMTDQVKQVIMQYNNMG